MLTPSNPNLASNCPNGGKGNEGLICEGWHGLCCGDSERLCEGFRLHVGVLPALRDPKRDLPLSSQDFRGAERDACCDR